MTNIKLSTGTSALTLLLIAFAPQSFAQGVTARPAKPTLDSLQAQLNQLTAAFQAEHTARLAAEAAEVNNRTAAVAAVSTSLNSLSTTVGNHSTAITSLQTSTATLTTTVNSFSTAVDDLQDKTQYLSVSGTTTRFTGTNVQIINGSNDTEMPNGLGNLIVGYNEGVALNRTGSHNLVLGVGNSYSSVAGAIFGANNTISNPYATILGGANNTATGFFSSILGGVSNLSSNQYATVGGGGGNISSGLASTVGGGDTTTESRSYGWRAGTLNN